MDALAQLNASLAGRYALDREIGRGGMATVYLARDVRHNRRVAVKVLNPELGAVLGVERFLAEIQVTANLQHPNLLALFDSGEAEGLLFYVMPYIEGESLRKRLQREKQLPMDEAVRIGTAVASALDYAHRHGVIHRDLKPENILLHEGQPLVADFGIALAVSVAGGERVTQTGISLGTPHYMSPEQATGDRAIDARTDIYSLGALMYEVLSGDPPHTASTAQAVIARVLTDVPRSLRLTRPSVPAHVDAAISRALEKLPADRWNTAHELADALQGRAVSLPSDVVTPGSAVRETKSAKTRWPRIVALTGAAVAVAALAASAAWITARRSADERSVRFTLDFPPNERMWAGTGPGRTLAISPDGNQVAYATYGRGRQHLTVRSLGDVAPRVLEGTDGAIHPFYSPDGRWIAFLADQQLKKVPSTGGPVSSIAEVGQVYGATWATDNQIVIAFHNQLAIVTTSGGSRPRPFTPKDTSQVVTLRWPRALPDGKTILYTRWTGGLTTARLAVTSIETGETRELNLEGTSPLGVIDGHLLYATSTGALFAAPFDVNERRITGSPMLVVDQVAVGVTGAAVADASRASITYQSGSAVSTVVLADAAGNTRNLISAPAAYSNPRFSPKGDRVALGVRGSGSIDIHVYSIASGTLTRLTTVGTVNDRSEWTPDGRRLLFRSERENGLGLWWQTTDFTGTAEPLQVSRDRPLWEGIITPDGGTLIYRTGTLGNADIHYRRLSGDTTSKPFATSPFTDWAARISPDGKWVAYASDESRTLQVYVRPFPGPGPRIQVSVDGGTSPLWSPDGRRIYFVNAQQFIAATVRTSPSFAIIERQTLFESDFIDLPGHANYDVSPDGKSFLMLKPSITGDQIVVAHNWRTELRARVREARQSR